jgi:hypothetical protein
VFYNPANVHDKNIWDNCYDIKKSLIEKIKEWNPEARDPDILSVNSQTNKYDPEDDDDEKVTLYASFTDWKPLQMIPFLKYIEIIDADPDYD